MDAEEALLRKLSELDAQARALEEQLQDREVQTDGARYGKVAQQLAPLSKQVEPYRAYLRAEQERNEAEEMAASEDDPELRAMAEEEIEALTGRRAELLDAMKEAFLSGDPAADRNVIVEIRAGIGGDEASLFAGDLVRMYSRFAERSRWRMELLDSNEGNQGGFKEVVFRIKGQGAYRALKFESGGHRVQRVPKTETQGRVHTSMATVGVLPEAEEIDVQIHQDDLRVDTMRAGGPGGQHVNKTESAVRIVHLPTGIEVKCQEKSQHQNRAQAMRILRAKLYEHEQAKAAAERGELRRSLIGSGDRSEKIRTYNVPQNRVSDHRIELTVYDLSNILDGAIDPFVEALTKWDREQRLRDL